MTFLKIFFSILGSQNPDAVEYYGRPSWQTRYSVRSAWAYARAFAPVAKAWKGAGFEKLKSAKP